MTSLPDFDKFVIKGSVEFGTTNSQVHVILRHANGSEVTCFLNGATVI
jgi:hypothetical protein